MTMYDLNRVGWDRKFEEGWNKIMRVDDIVKITKVSSVHCNHEGIIRNIDFKTNAKGIYVVEIAGLRVKFTGDDIEKVRE